MSDALTPDFEIATSKASPMMPTPIIPTFIEEFVDTKQG
jgi:hypothetical protein